MAQQGVHYGILVRYTVDY